MKTKPCGCSVTRQVATLRIRRTLVACDLAAYLGRNVRDWRRDISACYQPVYGHRAYEVADPASAWMRWVARKVSDFRA